MFAALAYLDLVTTIKTEHIINIYMHLFMLMDAGLFVFTRFIQGLFIPQF
jgi:hypothetical protein